jgi:hypothetical protein
MLVLAAWFLRCSSTGSWGIAVRTPHSNQRCPRNGKWTGLACQSAPTFVLLPLDPFGFGKATKVVSTSPDTGQQGGFAFYARPCAQALSGKAVRAELVYLRHETSFFIHPSGGISVAVFF